MVCVIVIGGMWNRLCDVVHLTWWDEKCDVSRSHYKSTRICRLCMQHVLPLCVLRKKLHKEPELEIFCILCKCRSVLHMNRLDQILLQRISLWQHNLQHTLLHVLLHLSPWVIVFLAKSLTDKHDLKIIYLYTIKGLSASPHNFSTACLFSEKSIDTPIYMYKYAWSYLMTVKEGLFFYQSPLCLHYIGSHNLSDLV